MKISNAAAIAGLNAKLALLNVGGAGRIDILDGTQPADVSVAIGAQNVLGSCVLTATAFPTAVDNTGQATATASSITPGTAGAAGTATWFRAYDGAGLAIIDGSAGLSGASPELVLDDETFEVNDTITVASWVINQPE